MSKLEKDEKMAEEDCEYELVDSWSESLIRSDVESIITNISEVCLDAVLEDGIVKDITFISSIVSLYKIGHTLKERWYVKKLIVFLDGIRKGIADESERQQYLGRIAKNKKVFQKELEYVLMLLDRINSEIKVQYITKLYLAFIKGVIDWAQFLHFSEVVDRILSGDAEFLRNNSLEDTNRDKLADCAMLRLQGLGLVKPVFKAGAYDINGNVIATMNQDKYDLTAFGRLFAKVVLTE